jgi:hypothetical protein
MAPVAEERHQVFTIRRLIVDDQNGRHDRLVLVLDASPPGLFWEAQSAEALRENPLDAARKPRGTVRKSAVACDRPAVQASSATSPMRMA